MPLFPTPIGEIAPEAPAASLLTTARRLPVGYEAWRSGVSWLPNGCNRVHGWSDCDDESRPAEKCDPLPNEVVAFRPWMIYVPDGCDSLPQGRAIDYNSRITAVIEAYGPGAVSRELATGEFGVTNPSLESTATTIGVPGPVTVLEAIALLLAARERAGFLGVSMVHLPTWLIPGGDNAYLWLNGGLTGLGSVRLSTGPGYPGRNPVDVGVPVDPATGQGYIFISGPVEYDLGPIQLPMNRENQRLRTNKTTYIGERPAIVRFDPCGVFAVLARIGN